MTYSLRLTSAVCALMFVTAAAIPEARQAPAGVTFTATSANVAEPGDTVRIQILRWSADEQRTQLIAALNTRPAAPAVAADGDAGAAARGGRTAAAGRGGRGGRGRGGRGGAPAAPLTPTAALTAAIGSAPTVGYIWTSDVTGYSIKYAFRTALPGGGERIILATDRRLGTHSADWKPVASVPPTEYEFTVIEMRLDPKGSGEAKASLTTKVIVDTQIQSVALENYDATPAILQNVTAASEG